MLQFDYLFVAKVVSSYMHLDIFNYLCYNSSIEVLV